MRRDDMQVLREVQKNAERAIKAIDTVSTKVYNDELAMDLSEQSLKYSEIRNKAVDKILKNKGESHKGSAIEDILLAGGIHADTLLDTSTGKIAEVMIKEHNRSVTNMCKSLNGHDRAGFAAVEIAEEFVSFEEKTIEKLKEFLR